MLKSKELIYVHFVRNFTEVHNSVSLNVSFAFIKRDDWCLIHAFVSDLFSFWSFFEFFFELWCFYFSRFAPYLPAHQQLLTCSFLHMKKTIHSHLVLVFGRKQTPSNQIWSFLSVSVSYVCVDISIVDLFTKFLEYRSHFLMKSRALRFIFVLFVVIVLEESGRSSSGLFGTNS